MILFVNSIFENIYFIFLLANYKDELYHNFVDLSIIKRKNLKKFFPYFYHYHNVVCSGGFALSQAS